ncbi:CvfB family protein [Pelagibaculum spongiae]|nr:S1-like domain-containing RNA-binding protein [Pelagibaculum spongiae]
MNRLKVIKQVDFGLFLDGGNKDIDGFGEILLPRRYVPENTQIGDDLDVFIYLDSEDQYIATTETPKVMLGQFACLNVAMVNQVGAFLDWGLPKDLLVPFAQQRPKMEEDRHYVVYVYLDNSGRIAATGRYDKHLNQSKPEYKSRQKVNVLVAGRTDLGTKVIVENAHWGQIFQSDITQPLKYGQKLEAFIKKIHENGNIDIMLEQPGYAKIDALSQSILNKLHASRGFLPVHDKTDPELIRRLFLCSKKSFKQAIGGLKRQGLIEIQGQGIKLL